MAKEILFTGIQPTGGLHIGNYLGAIEPTIKHQDEYENFLCVVDLHALTKPWDPKEMPEQVKNITLDYLAAGIDPKKSTLFIQSHVPEHSELMWLLTTIAPLGELQRMIQYKEFVERFGDPLGGTLMYPVLMAADIMLYKANVVPVGDDQTQHIELTRDLVKKFNRNFGETFPVPKQLTLGESLRVMSLHDPSKKMSKSLGPKSYIGLADEPDTIRKKIMSAVTDSGEELSNDMSPGVKNLFHILSLTAPEDTVKRMTDEYNEGGMQYGNLKAVVADNVIEFLEPIQKKRAELEGNLEYVARVLAEGSEKAREIASKNLQEVKQKMGLL